MTSISYNLNNNAPWQWTNWTDLLHSMEVLFPEYFQSISKIFPCHENNVHTMELKKKTMEIGFSNLFPMVAHWEVYISSYFVPHGSLAKFSSSESNMFESYSRTQMRRRQAWKGRLCLSANVKWSKMLGREWIAPTHLFFLMHPPLILEKTGCG